jgi:hypothetical protein
MDGGAIIVGSMLVIFFVVSAKWPIWSKTVIEDPTIFFSTPPKRQMGSFLIGFGRIRRGNALISNVVS